jgi:pyrophosphatase PpaX
LNDRFFMPAKLLICDLDGTLIDSLPMVIRAFRHAVEPWKRWDDDAELRRMLNGHYLACLGLLMPKGAPLEAAVERLVDYSRAHEGSVEAFDRAEWFLESASARVPVVLWTNRDRHSSVKHLRNLGFDRFVRGMVCGDDFPVHKPEPTGIHRLLSELGVAPSEAIFIGDSDVDVQGGVAAGIETVLIRRGQELPEDLLRSADRVFEEPGAAYEWVLERLQK